MKIFQILKAAVISAGLSLMLVSCNDNGQKKDYTAPGPVTEVTAESGFGRVVLKWKAPEDALYYYTKIEYLNPLTGRSAWAYASKFNAGSDGYTSRVIGGFVDEGDHVFSLTTHGFSYGSSSPVTVTGHVMETPFNSVAGTLAVASDIMGALLSWENDSQVPVIVKASFKDIHGADVSVRMMSDTDCKMRLGSIAPEEQQVRVTVFDETNTHSSEESTFTISPNNETPVKLSKAGWSIAECSSAWDSPDQGGQWVPEHLVDDNIMTAWHTNPAAGNYPFHAVVDMQAATVITSVEVSARQQDPANGPNKISFQMSDDNATWYDAGTFDFERLNTSAQTFDLMQTNYGARYLKVILVEGPANFSCMGEVTPFGKLR